MDNITADSEDVPIMYSNEKLKMLLEESGLPIEEIFKNYIENLKYEPIKDFPLGTSWFNTQEPLTFKKHLKGKLVLLDFFTYCCINCMHILPDLKEIEHSFSVEDGLVVIGVHSAKFENETDARNVQNAVLRYNIDHAVVNDDGQKMWKQCDIHCWPSLLLLSPDAQPLVLLMGEGHRDTLKLYIKHFLHFYNKQNKINNQSLAMITKTTDAIQHQEPLLFPGKLTVWQDGDQKLKSRLAISDSGNNRVIIIDGFDNNDEDKQFITVGSQCGESGFADGNFPDCSFNNPQGLVFLDRDTLFVCDTDNHAVRKIDFKTRTVLTVAGNGGQSNDRNGGRIGTQQGISSPWDLELYKTDDSKHVLLIAMAGTHQIWGIFLEDTKWWKGKEYKQGMVVCIAGSGREENRNNNYPNNAAFAQPSGLALDHKNKMVYIADSESSSVRKLSLIDGKVSAVCGGDKNPNNLFAFGDKDGVGYDSKLQHCLGLTMGSTPNSNKLFVADTYNHKIKAINTQTNQIQTIQTNPNLKAKFNEPCGLVQLQNGKLYITDTNSHQIKICTLNENETEFINIEMLKLENVDVQPLPDVIDMAVDPVYSLSQVNFVKHQKARINFNVTLKELHWTEGAPHRYSIQSQKGLVVTDSKDMKGPIKDTFGVDLYCELNDKTNQEHITDVIDVKFEVYTCLGDLCFNKKFIVRIPVTVTDGQGKIGDVNANIVIGKDNVNLFM